MGGTDSRGSRLGEAARVDREQDARGLARVAPGDQVRHEAAGGWRPLPPLGGEKAHRVVWTGDWWLPVHEIPHNLPHQATSFVGRERDQREVKTHLGTARLVTLLGMGGLGKTRMSLQLAAEVLDDYPDGVWLVELAPMRDAALVPQAVATALGVKEESGVPLADALARFVADRTLLIVVDNCEHLLAACAALVKRMLQGGTGLRVLATSREPLHLAGEVTFEVPALLGLPVGVGYEAVMGRLSPRSRRSNERNQDPREFIFRDGMGGDGGRGGIEKIRIDFTNHPGLSAALDTTADPTKRRSLQLVDDGAEGVA